MPQQQTPSLIGQTVEERYAVERLIAAGGMGEVYLAADKRTGGRVVLKSPWRGLLKDHPKLRDRFIGEIRTMSGLDHPNIVRVFDVTEHEGRPVAAMQYLSGGDLDARHDVPLERWLPQIADALDYLHANDLVHRDVKPGNIFFDSHDTPYLGDFGVVKAREDATSLLAVHNATQKGVSLGTPQYMSPEAVEGNELNGRADQYALAIIVYQRLAGRMPFDAETPAHIFAAHLMATPHPLSSVDPRHSEALSQVMQRALSKQPEDRFSSCREFAESVLAALGTRPADAATPAMGSAAVDTPPAPLPPIPADAPTLGASAAEPGPADPHPDETEAPDELAEPQEVAEPEKVAEAEESPEAQEVRSGPSEPPAWKAAITGVGRAIQGRPPLLWGGLASLGVVLLAVVTFALMPASNPPVSSFTLSFTVREESRSGPPAEKAMVGVYWLDPSGSRPMLIAQGRTDFRGRARMTIRLTAAEQKQGRLVATVIRGGPSKTFALEQFPEVQGFRLYVP